MIFGVLANDDWSVYDFPGFVDPSSHCSICRQRRHSEIFDIQRSSVEFGQSKRMHPPALRSLQRQIWGTSYGSTTLADIHDITHVWAPLILSPWHVGYSSGMCMFCKASHGMVLTLSKQRKIQTFHCINEPKQWNFYIFLKAMNNNIPIMMSLFKCRKYAEYRQMFSLL